jgi:hypothetical protein
MLNRQTYTPPPEAEAVILPLFGGHDRHLLAPSLLFLVRLKINPPTDIATSGKPPTPYLV